MAIDLKGLLDDLSKLPIPGVSQAAGVLSTLVGKPETPEQAAQIQAVVLAHEEAMRKLALAADEEDDKDAASVRDLAKAELASESAFVKNVRPGILAGLAACVFFWLVPAPIINLFVAEAHKLTPEIIGKIPDSLWYVFVSAYLGHGALRSWDKKNKVTQGAGS